MSDKGNILYGKLPKICPYFFTFVSFFHSIFAPVNIFSARVKKIFAETKFNY